MENLKNLRKSKRLTQTELAKLIGISQNNYSYWENDKVKIDNKSLEFLSNFFNVSIDYILGKDNIVKNNYIKINVLGKIPAGIPINAIEEIIDVEELSTKNYSPNNEYFALQIIGNSMNPKFLNNDIVICQRQEDCENGQYAVVIIDGNDATFKKIIKNNNGIILQPLNPNYEPLYFTNKQIIELPIKILGIVKEIRRKI